MDTDKLVFGIIGGITLLITAVIIFTSFSSSSSKDLEAQELLGIAGVAAHRKGPEDAKLVIVEFSDFECPYCAQYSPILTSLMAQYPNDLAVVYRHFPLPMHTGALPAARAAEAAHKQGKFWEYHDELFANQPNFAQSDLEQYAEIIGLNVDQFKSDYASSEVISKVQEDADYARKLGISSTPTFYAIYDGKAEVIKMEQYADLEEKVKSILGASAQASEATPSIDDQNTSDGPTVSTQIPADMPANITMAVTLDIINEQRDNVAPSQVNIVTVTKQTWPSADLGCPKPGQTYAQVETPGYKVIAETDEELFEYHTNEMGEVAVFCDATPK